MNKKLTQLALHRTYLVAQAAAQRTALANNLEPWRAPLALADRGLTALRYISHRPALLTGATLMMAALRPVRFGRWLGRGWLVWQLGRRLPGN